MAIIVRREVRRRSGWGKLWRFLFFAWNIVFGIDTLLMVGRVSRVLDGLHGLAGAVGTNIATHVLVRQVALWVAGAAVLGLLAYATRGEVYLVESTEEEAFAKCAARSSVGWWWILILVAALIVGFLGTLIVLGTLGR
jgi:hypothetical protein